MTQKFAEKSRFRANVAALVKIGDLFLRCQRTEPSGVWQTVQGGIEEHDASPRDALLRELAEELGISPGSVTILAQSRCWRRYYFPEDVLTKHPERSSIGQEQMWFLVELPNLSIVDLSRSEGEFCSVELVDLNHMLANIVSWKLPVMKDFCYEMGLLIPFSA